MKDNYEGSLTLPAGVPAGTSLSCYQYLELAQVATPSGGATATATVMPSPTIAANASLNATPTAPASATNATASPAAANGTTATPVDGGGNSSGGCCGTTLVFLLASVLCPALVLMKGRKK